VRTHTSSRCDHYALGMRKGIERSLAMVRAKSTAFDHGISTTRTRARERERERERERCCIMKADMARAEMYLSPTPPNGKLGFANCTKQSLMTAVPERVRRRTSDCVASTDENRYNANGFGRSSMKSMASSSVVTGITGRIGPKISSVIKVDATRACTSVTRSKHHCQTMNTLTNLDRPWS